MTTSKDEDEWKIAALTFKKFTTPTFVRVFVINRVLKHHISSNQHSEPTDQVVRLLINQCFASHKGYKTF